MFDLTKRTRKELSDDNQKMYDWQIMIEQFADEAQKAVNRREEPLNGRSMVQKLLTDGKRPRPA